MYKWIEEANRRTSDFNNNNVNPSKYSALYGNGKCAELNRRNYETFQKNNKTDYVPKYYISR